MKNLRLRYHVLKTVVNALGLFEWLAGGYGLLSFYSQDAPGWQLALILMVVSYFVSCELGYYVGSLQIRIELRGNKENNDAN